MSTADEIDRAAPESAAHHALPDPGESVPKLALPTVGIFLVALTAFGLSTLAVINGRAPLWVAIGVNAAVTFVMFTVAHDASHYSISGARWVNGVFGRLAFFFVSPLVAFPSFGYVHIQHHRHANDDEEDPDTFASHGSLWLLPFRWPMAEYFYLRYYLPRVRSRPVSEVAETLVVLALSLTGLVVTVVTGNFWTLLVVFLVPQRLGITVLAWWFDWLPHHALKDTQRTNRYRATRNRVGAEWLFTPLMLSQNYHLVHHLHPSVPFYRYLRIWERNEEAYLERNAAISTVFGQELNPEEFREWKRQNGLTSSLKPDSVDEWFICGPMGMTTTVRESLLERGVGSALIHLELFYGHDTAPSTERAYGRATVTFTLSGQQETFDLVAGDSILEGALQRRSDAPYACMGGACGTCRAKLVKGEVEMDHNFALGQAELDAGYILTCQSHPTTPFVSVDYDA
jgi:fatty acid desaturase/ferredoxin